ncbi:hypothetical protein [Novipirellula aureliae]|uniref:hypothetical protein n=1 Tax=Novipirellula aureliae TaxID=2527966 RepID=UPI0011B437D1|nr:hypothetical protein [Novipirellula aureliae]
MRRRSRSDRRRSRIARRRHRAKRPKEESNIAYSRCRHFGETPFPVSKVMFDLPHFLLRGIEGVAQEERFAEV